MGKLTLFIIVSMVLVLGIFSSTAFIVYAAPIKTSVDKCIKYYHSETGGLLLERCCYKNYVDNKLVSSSCVCNNAQFENVKCPTWTNGDFKRTFNPGLKDGAGAGVLKGEDEDDSKDTNIGNNGGILMDRGTTNTSNNTNAIPK